MSDNKQNSSLEEKKTLSPEEKAKKVIEEASLKDNKKDLSIEFVKTDPSDTTEYVVFASSLKILDGEGKVAELKQHTIITKKDYPSTWIEMALAQRFLIKAQDLKTMTPEQRAELGYTGTFRVK
jgi:hypothetical protein